MKNYEQKWRPLIGCLHQGPKWQS